MGTLYSELVSSLYAVSVFASIECLSSIMSWMMFNIINARWFIWPWGMASTLHTTETLHVCMHSILSSQFLLLRIYIYTFFCFVQLATSRLDHSRTIRKPSSHRRGSVRYFNSDNNHILLCRSIGGREVCAINIDRVNGQQQHALHQQMNICHVPFNLNSNYSVIYTRRKIHDRFFWIIEIDLHSTDWAH